VDPTLAFILYLLAFGLLTAGGIWSAVLRSWPLALGLFGLAVWELVALITAGQTAF
jgi:hypothetical protein